MKKLIASLILASLSGTVFAIPAEPQKLLFEAQPSHDQTTTTVAEGGFERTPLGLQLADDGFDRTPLGRLLAEGGSDRLIERNS
ncbi:hypothetical protein [Stutzerimonas azotifigens]|uniref:Phage infection protein n=1 Tax=Stutzerimonas azotifigens TaxID=291995 RepID=A0ABR5YX30_9GAMM|nr:hypothetical protein [Stutzerimonas azotifigens]MBA1272510.1 hypothetical protein [Stutzerimonas azotifigens]